MPQDAPQDRIDLVRDAQDIEAQIEQQQEDKLERTETDTSIKLVYYGSRIETPEQLIEAAQVDMSIWEIDRVQIKNWEVTGKAHQGQVADPKTGTPLWLPQHLWKSGNRYIAVTLRRKRDERVAIEQLLEQLKEKGPVRARAERPGLDAAAHERLLEISLMDVHYGMMCFYPEADADQSLRSTEDLMLLVLEEILRRASVLGPFQKVLFVMGNDYLHSDGVFHTTTAGTAQPESLSWHYIYERGEEFLISVIERLREVAPVHIVEVPGNHDRQSAFTMGRVLRAYYRRDPEVTVDVSAAPYKFVRFGMNLIGFEHGHSVKGARLAAIMANCCPRDWHETSGGYREFHLGDQHRKGSAVPAYFEEQGVSVEYCPGLTMPNAWHRLKGFNFQKTGGMGWVWDKQLGPVARFPVHVNRHTSAPLGMPGSQDAVTATQDMTFAL